MNEIVKPYVFASCFSEYHPINKYVGIISKNQAREDLNILRYLMENRYCGWEYYENQGVNWDDYFKSIDNVIASESDIYISDFCKAIHKAFNVGVVDNHLSFCSPLTGRLSYAKQYTAYFADFKVEQVGDNYCVVESNSSDIADGDMVEANGCLYPTLSPTQHNRYLVGLRSFTPVTEMTVTINGRSICVPLHRCKAINNTESYDVCLHHVSKEGIDILRANCCDYVGDLSEETDLVEMGRQFKDKHILILNYLSNEGGYNRITREFIQGLNGYSHCSEYSIKLISPVTEGKSCERQWVLLSEAETYDYSKATFDGKLIMLVNSGTASSGETAVLYARSCKNLILIGENTMG